MTKEEMDRPGAPRPGAAGAVALDAVPGHVVPVREPAGASRRLQSLTRLLSLGAILAVVVLVTLPRLRAFALSENELDARALLRMLGGSNAVQAAAPGASLADLEFASRVLSAETRGARVEEGGARLRLHGYLFDLDFAAAGSAEGSADAAPAVRAWPYVYGRTGHAAYVLTGDGELRVHDNAGGDWSGGAAAPAGPYDAARGWRLLRKR